MRNGKNVMFGLLLASVAGVSYIAGAVGAGKGTMIAAEAIVFEPVAGRPVQTAPLWGDRSQGAHGRLVKLPPGFEAGSHAHTADYHGINLKGIWVHTMDGETKELPVGSYVMQPGGQFHNDVCKGPEECILFVHQDAKADFIPADAKKE